MTTQAQTLDAKVKQLAKNLLLTEAEVLSTLMEMSRAKVFPELNYTGVFDYCFRALNFSREQSYYYKKVAEVSEAVPEFKEALQKGELSLSTARRIAPILNTENQAEWIDKAKTFKQSELEKAVAVVNPQARPREKIKPVAKNISELRVAVDDETDANLNRLKDLLSQKLKRPATLGDVVAWAARETVEKFDPERKALRASKRVSSGNAVRPAQSTRPKVATGGPREPAETSRSIAMTERRPIPAGIRHEVVRRQGAQCSFTSSDHRRCEQRRWIDLHHRKPVSQDGVNTVENLTFLCSSHHRSIHEKGRLSEPALP